MGRQRDYQPALYDEFEKLNKKLVEENERLKNQNNKKFH